MKVTVIPGVTYAVTPAAECTVTTLEGVLIASCPAGSQTCFIAPCAEVEVSDDAALVTESFKGASAGSAAGGGVRTLYEYITQTPAEGNLSNVNTYGFAIVTTQSGRLDSIALAPRSSGGVEDRWPMYLKIWVADGDRWNVLGTSLNAVAQVAGTPSIWRFAGVNLEAGRKIQIEARKNPDSTIHDSRLSASVVANTLADTGCIDAQGRLSMTDWVPQYTLSLSRETGIGYRGVQLAEQADLDAHTGDTAVHITEEERTTWNNKADTSALSGKVNTTTFNAHKSDTVIHISPEDRQRWDASGGSGSFQTLDVEGNGTFGGSVTMEQSLNVVGETILRRLEILGGQYSVFTVETARATWTNTQAGYFRLQADKAGEQEVILELGSGKVDDRACLVKPGQSGPLTERDVPNCQEGDARWVKFNNTLTDAEYAALAVKDQTTLYITSDTGKVYLGSYALN